MMEIFDNSLRLYLDSIATSKSGLYDDQLSVPASLQDYGLYGSEIKEQANVTEEELNDSGGESAANALWDTWKQYTDTGFQAEDIIVDESESLPVVEHNRFRYPSTSFDITGIEATDISSLIDQFELAEHKQLGNDIGLEAVSAIAAETDITNVVTKSSAKTETILDVCEPPKDGHASIGNLTTNTGDNNNVTSKPCKQTLIPKQETLVASTPPTSPPREIIEKIKASSQRKSTILIDEVPIKSRRAHGYTTPTAKLQSKIKIPAQNSLKRVVNEAVFLIDHDYCREPVLHPSVNAKNHTPNLSISDVISVSSGVTSRLSTCQSDRLEPEMPISKYPAVSNSSKSNFGLTYTCRDFAGTSSESPTNKETVFRGNNVADSIENKSTLEPDQEVSLSSGKLNNSATFLPEVVTNAKRKTRVIKLTNEHLLAVKRDGGSAEKDSIAKLKAVLRLLRQRTSQSDASRNSVTKTGEIAADVPAFETETVVMTTEDGDVRPVETKVTVATTESDDVVPVEAETATESNAAPLKEFDINDTEKMSKVNDEFVLGEAVEGNGHIRCSLPTPCDGLDVVSSRKETTISNVKPSSSESVTSKCEAEQIDMRETRIRHSSFGSDRSRSSSSSSGSSSSSRSCSLSSCSSSRSPSGDRSWRRYSSGKCRSGGSLERNRKSCRYQYDSDRCRSCSISPRARSRSPRRNRRSRSRSSCPQRRSRSRSFGRRRYRSRSRRSRRRKRSYRERRYRSRSRRLKRDRSLSRKRLRRAERRRAEDEERQKQKVEQMEERRIIYVGRIPDGTARRDLRRRFERFGPIEEVSVHFRDEGDNYGFVTFVYKCDAFAAIEEGNNDPSEPQFELCFGGRRHFCQSSYADLDSMPDDVQYADEKPPPPVKKQESDFDALLRSVQRAQKKKLR